MDEKTAAALGIAATIAVGGVVLLVTKTPSKTPPPTGSYNVAISASSSSVQAGTAFTLVLTVTNASGAPVSGETVQIMNDNTEQVYDGTTDSNGIYSLQLTIGTAGQYTFTGQSANSNTQPTVVVNIVSETPPPTLPSISLNTSSVTYSISDNSFTPANLVISGTGFTPNGNVEVYIGTLNLTGYSAASDGSISISVNSANLVVFGTQSGESVSISVFVYDNDTGLESNTQNFKWIVV